METKETLFEKLWEEYNSVRVDQIDAGRKRANINKTIKIPCEEGEFEIYIYIENGVAHTFRFNAKVKYYYDLEMLKSNEIGLEQISDYYGKSSVITPDFLLPAERGSRFPTIMHTTFLSFDATERVKKIMFTMFEDIYNDVINFMGENKRIDRTKYLMDNYPIFANRKLQHAKAEEIRYSRKTMLTTLIEDIVHNSGLSLVSSNYFGGETADIIFSTPMGVKITLEMEIDSSLIKKLSINNITKETSNSILEAISKID